MKVVENALTNLTAMYKNNSIEYEVVAYIPEDTRWVVNIYNKDAPGSLLQVEIIDDDGIPKCCVLQKVNVGRTSMVRFMDRLVDALE